MGRKLLLLSLLALAWPLASNAQYGHQRILIYVLSDRYDDDTWVNWYQNPLHLYHVATNLASRGYQVEAIDRAVHPSLPIDALSTFSQVWISECDVDGVVDVSPLEVEALKEFKRQGGGVWISLEGTLPGENWTEDGMSYAGRLGTTWKGNHYGPSRRTVSPTSHPLLNGVQWLKFDGEVGQIASTNSSLVLLWEYDTDRGGILIDDGTTPPSGRAVVDAGWTLGYCWFDPPSADSQARGNLRFLHQLADWLEPSRPGITPLPNHIGPTSGTDILVTDVSVDSSGVLLFNLLTPKPGIRYLIEGTTDFKIWNLLTTFIADTRATRITSVVDADRPNFFRIRADSVAEAFLRFPLLGGNPFNAPVTALFDHSPALGVVVAYNGERGDDAGSRVERAAGTGYGQSPPPGSSCPCSTTMMPSG